jgi:hypothetical protein
METGTHGVKAPYPLFPLTTTMTDMFMRVIYAVMEREA